MQSGTETKSTHKIFVLVWGSQLLAPPAVHTPGPSDSPDALIEMARLISLAGPVMRWNGYSDEDVIHGERGATDQVADVTDVITFS